MPSPITSLAAAMRLFVRLHRMRDLSLKVLLTSVFFLCVCCSRAQDSQVLRSPGLCGATNWSRVSPGSSRFSALMPMQPTISVKTNQTETGPSVVTTLKTEVSRTVAFGLLHHKFPKNSLEVQEQSFAQGVKATLGPDGRLVSERVISLGGYPGREWCILKSQGQVIITMRSYIVGDDILQAVSIMPKA